MEESPFGVRDQMIKKQFGTRGGVTFLKRASSGRILGDNGGAIGLPDLLATLAGTTKGRLKFLL